jgi:TolA-binding protein
MCYLRPFVTLGVVASLLLCIGCVTDSAEESKLEADKAPDSTPTAAGNDENLPIELKQAKIWTRLDAIEQEQSRQRARIKLLEQGLLLGVVPDELRDPADLEHERRQKEKSKKKLEAAPAQPQVQSPDSANTPPTPATVEKSNDRSQYEKEFSAAQELIREGRYGRAIVALEEIGSKFDEQTTAGAHHYWIGVCWFNLKDYDAATKHLQTLVQKHTTSPWVPRSKLYLARIQVRRGLREQALSSFQQIISDHKNEDAADMARADIEALKSSL